ncbi:4993_t:CDS:2, partial [Racocetra persica]
FADLNFLYWILFGRSSLELSALMPRDPAANKKAIMYLLINLTWPILADFDFNNIYTLKPFFKNPTFGGIWTPLDHSDAIEKVQAALKKGQIPIITAKTGA